MTNPLPFLTRHRVPVTWIVTFLGCFLLGASWSVAMPYDGPPDELQHVVKAYAVAGGELGAPSTSAFTVPASLVPPGNGCFRWNLTRDASCQTSPGAAGPATTHEMTSAMSGAWSYNPAYYLLVGPVIHAMPTYQGVILARLLNAALISALLASALTVVIGLRDGRWLLAGVLASTTPVLISLEGAVNASGLEIAAGIAVWVALIAIIDADQPGPAAIWLGTVSACLLAVLRGFGVGWLALILATAALGLDRRRLLALARLRPLRIAAAVTLVFAVYGAFWDTHVTHLIPAKPTPSPLNTSVMQVFKLWSHTPTSQMYLFEVWFRLPFYVEGMIGRTSYGDVVLPGAAFILWYAALGVLILGALVFCGWRTRARIAAIIVSGVALLVLADVSALRSGFYLSQGRYALPLMLGAPLLASHALGREGVLSDRQSRQLTRAYVLTLLPTQFPALWLTMVRFQRGEAKRFPVNGINPLIGRWLPPYGPLLPLGLCLTGVLLVGALVWWLAGLPGTPHPPPDATPDEPTRAAAHGDPVLTLAEPGG